jgi:formate dehydrogenase major subunit
MTVSRRGFLSAAGTSAAALGLFGLTPGDARAQVRALRTLGATRTTTVCPYCGGGCGQIISVRDGKLIANEGDPDHPVNEGALCSKAQALFQVVNNDRRATKVLYRAPGAAQWESRDWDWAIARIAANIRRTRDETFQASDGEKVVNRTMGIAGIGAAALDTEECYLWTKLARALGIVYLEHQARLCHSSTVAGLAASFGRGAMTNHWADIANADVVLVIGSNAAENHPISFHWVQKAKDRGAKLIHVDPRFTRTSALADVYAPIRTGTDIAFIGGIINYVLQNKLYDEFYVVNYTNAGFIVGDSYRFAEGLFSGYNPEKRAYDASQWGFVFTENGPGQAAPGGKAGQSTTTPRIDRTLNDPRCVLSLLKAHFARYDLATASSVTGCPKEKIEEIARILAETARPGKAGTIMYAMGTTQHTVGTQYIRSYAILQLLLGNIGVAGGGINAMRGESNVQGSTDMAVLFHILPGYLKAPDADNTTLQGYLDKWTPKTDDPRSVNWWSNTPKYTVSLLKAWFGDAGTPANEFGYQFLPKKSGNYSWIPLFEAMFAGKIKGLISMGQNPAVSGPNLNLERQALDKLEWAVVADLWETETAAFWKRPGVDPADIRTEVFLLPAASSVEKEGSVTNSGRWAQWRYPAIAPLGQARSDLWILDRIFKAVRAEYGRGGVFPDPILQLDWNYGDDEPSAHEVAREINGRFLADADFPDRGKSFKKGQQVPNFTFLKEDGTTACGCWIYCGSYTGQGPTAEKGNNMARRDRTDAANGIGLSPGWAWAWPLNRRILYNRASVDLAGQPRDPQRWVIRWDPTKDGGKGGWLGDVPDGPAPPLLKPDGTPDEKGKYPFIMERFGHGSLFSLAPTDGPLPEHYEPWESPVQNLLNPQPFNPVSKLFNSSGLNMRGDPERFPVVATTFRVTEHWQAGAMTRNLPWLCELVPDNFVEMSQQLAARKGIRHGDRVRVLSARGSVTGYAVVTARFQPLEVQGRTIDQVGLPWHFGYCGIAQGDSANLLTPNIGDANTTIPEYKSFLCDVVKEA